MEHVVSQSLLRRSVSGHLRIRFTGPVETRTARAGLAIGIVAAAVLALPVRVLSTGAGWVDGGTGNHLVPTASFAVGLTCLTAAIWAAARAVTDTSVERASLVALGLTSAAPFGAVTRELLQVSALHRFYLSAGSGGFLAAYWGLALLAVATLSFCLPLMVVAANLVPRRFSSARGRRSITALSHRRGYLLAPMIGAALLITMCAVVPESLGATMGYSAPGANGSRIGVTNDVLNEAVWNSFARLAFLPLLVGVWEGMESARACLLLSGPFGLRRLVDTVASRGSTREGGGGGPGGTRVLAGAATFGACVAAAATHVPLSLLLGAAAVIGVVVYATAGLTPRLAAIPSPRNAGTRWNVSAAWQATSPIALVLLVLAAPVAVPLGLDLWRGLEAPFRLPSDALHYVYFWREPGHMQVPSVTPGGVFGHGMWQVVQWSLALAVVLAVLAATIRLSEHRQPSILTPTFWLLVRVAVIALAFIPIMNAAARPATAWILGAFAAPAMLVALRLRADAGAHAARLAVASFALLGAWSYLMWQYDSLPSSAVLAATVLWRFVFNAGELNEIEDGPTQFRRICAFAAIAFLGLGLLLLDHGGVSGVFATDRFSEVASQVAVSVVAPVWLAHLVLLQTSLAPRRAPEPTRRAGAETRSA